MYKLIMVASMAMIIACTALPSRGATICQGTSMAVSLDITAGVRTAAASETILYSTAWVDGAASGATAVVAVDGMTLASAAGDGLVEWMPSRNGTYTLTHKVMSNGVQYGETLTATFLVDKPSLNAPVFSPASNTTFDSSLSVSISCATEGATIHYTTDGSEPTAESTVYRRFRIYGKTTVKAVAELNGILSDVVVAEYALGRCADPVIEAGTSFTGNKTQVSISCATEGATVYYTLNGNDPDSHSAVYTEPFDVTNGCTLKVYATKAEYFDSAVVGKKIEKAGGIGETMGDPNQVFTTDGSGGLGWTRVVDATAPNGVAMKSGAITHSQSSVLSTTVTGPGTLTFSWRTSCEEDELHEWDHAEFVVDGTVRLILDGITGWRNESVAITGSGNHTVEWRYVKDNAESDGEDAAWAAGFRWEPVQTATQTTQVPVPYAWLRAHDPTVADEYEAYEAAAKNMAANGHKVWECYVLGLDPQVATSDFRIVSFPMKADGTPDWTNVAFDPPQERWNVPDAPVVWKGAAQLEGPWRTVSAEDGSPGTTRPTMRFFKAVVFGDVDDEPQPPDPPSPDPESYRCDGLPVRPVRGADQ